MKRCVSLIVSSLLAAYVITCTVVLAQTTSEITRVKTLVTYPDGSKRSITVELPYKPEELSDTPEVVNAMANNRYMYFNLYPASDNPPTDLYGDNWSSWEFTHTTNETAWFSIPVPYDFGTNMAFKLKARVNSQVGSTNTTAVFQLQYKVVDPGEIANSTNYDDIIIVTNSFSTNHYQFSIIDMFTDEVDIFTNSDAIIQGAVERLTDNASDLYDGDIEVNKLGAISYKSKGK